MARNAQPAADHQDEDQNVSLEEPFAVADGEELDDEDEEKIRKYYGLDDPEDEEEADPAAGAEPDAEEAPPAAQDSAQPADDPAADPGEEPAGTDAGDDAGAADDPAAEEQGGEGEGDPPADAAAGAEGQPEGAPAAAPPQPVKLRVDKKEVEIPGSLEFEAEVNGEKQQFVTMPKAAIERYLRPYLADRAGFRNEKLELLRRVASAEEAVTSHPDILQSKQIISVLDSLLELHRGDESGEKVLARLDEITAKRGEWEREAEIRSRDQRIEALQKVTPPADEVLEELEAEQQQEALRTDLERELTAMIRTDTKRYGGVDAQDLLAELVEDYRKVVFLAEDDITDEQGTVLVPKGEPFIHRGEIKRRLEREATRIERVRTQLEQREEARRRNDAALGRPSSGKPRKQQQPTPAPQTVPSDDEDDEYARWQRDFLGERGPQIID